MIDWGDVVQALVTGTIVGSIGMWLSDRLNRRRSRRQMATGRTVVAARSLTGRAHPVLSPMWMSFRATPRPGRLDLRHAVINDETTAVAVTAVEPGDRRPPWREKWRLDVVDPRVLTVRTPEGRIELAVADDQVDWVRTRLTGADLPAPG
jgi:hypothetical protein